MIASAIILAVLVAFGGLVAVIARAAKTNGIAEATLDETREDLEAVSRIMKEAKENEALRDKTYRNTLAGIRPDSVRKYDRKV